MFKLAPVRPVVYGYYPSWDNGLAPENIAYHRFTHLSHAFVRVEANGKLRTEGNLPSRALTERAHQANVRVLLAIGGASSGTSLGKVMSADRPELAQVFVKEVVYLARTYGYDGLDVDWEFPEEKREELVRLVRMLRRELAAWKPDALLTMAVPAQDWYGKWFDAAALLNEVDFLQVMTYDVHCDWPSSHAGHNSPLHPTRLDPEDGAAQSFAAFVSYWEKKGFPRHKLLVGIPCYGRGFRAAGWGQKPTGKSQHASLSFRQIRTLPPGVWKSEWDAEAQVPYLTRRDGGKIVELLSYEDEKSARAKGKWAKEQGLRGFFFWEISQDFVDEDHRLVKAAREGWESGK